MKSPIDRKMIVDDGTSKSVSIANKEFVTTPVKEEQHAGYYEDPVKPSVVNASDRSTQASPLLSFADALKSVFSFGSKDASTVSGTLFDYDETETRLESDFGLSGSINDFGVSDLGSVCSSQEWGWFEDVDTSAEYEPFSASSQSLDARLQHEEPVAVPSDVLEKSLSSQLLWRTSIRESSGNTSDYNQLRRGDEDRSSKDSIECRKGKNEDVVVLSRKSNGFTIAVSKSFPRTRSEDGVVDGVDTFSVAISTYRVIESRGRKLAQFLVVYRKGAVWDTFGVWKRFSDFSQLAEVVKQTQDGGCSFIWNWHKRAILEEDYEIDSVSNALRSWKLLMERKRWYRCFDEKYLIIKCFLLERFLQDVLFETTNPTLLQHFVDDSLTK